MAVADATSLSLLNRLLDAPTVSRTVGVMESLKLALEGIGALSNTVARVKQRLNPKLHIAGVVLTMVDRRMTLSQQVEADVRGHFGELVFGTTIPRNVRIAEAPSHGLPVLIYDNACAGAQAYILLASEFIRRRRQVAEQVQHEPAS